MNDVATRQEMELPVNYDTIHFTERKAVREEYIRRQNGRCHYCGVSLSGEPSKRIKDRPINLNLFPHNFLKWPVHLHHDHNTGMTIGAVHAYCNAVLWQYHGE